MGRSGSQAATIAGKPLAAHGIDRFKMRDGKVYDATIVFDPTFVTEVLHTVGT